MLTSTSSNAPTGIVGAGLMGQSIARVFADAGWQVRLFDRSDEALAAAVDSLTSAGYDVKAVGSLAELADGSSFITEAIFENLELKQDVFAELSVADTDVVLASNTSVLPVTAIAAKATRPERVVGTHWWNPGDLIPLVEVVRGNKTSTEVMEATVGVLTSVGKTAVRVERDVPGFVGNRMQHALWREAIAIVADGIADAQTVDLVVRNTIGLRLAEMGPIENADLVGLDLTLAIHQSVLPDLNRDPHPSDLLQRLVAAGQLGAKTGSGFLPWGEGTREAAAQRLSTHVRRQLSDRTTPDGDVLEHHTKENK